LYAQRKVAEAEALHREALDLRRKYLPAGHPDLSQSLNNLGILLNETGRLPEAEPLLREAVAIRREKFGTDANVTQRSAGPLAWNLERTGRKEEAAGIRREFGLPEPAQHGTAPTTQQAR